MQVAVQNAMKQECKQASSASNAMTMRDTERELSRLQIKSAEKSSFQKEPRPSSLERLFQKMQKSKVLSLFRERGIVN